MIVLFRGTHNKHKTDTIVAVTSKPTSSHEESIAKPIQSSDRSSSTWKPQTLDVHQQQGRPIKVEIAETIHESRTKDQQGARRLNSLGGISGFILSNFVLVFSCSFLFFINLIPSMNLSRCKKRLKKMKPTISYLTLLTSAFNTMSNE